MGKRKYVHVPPAPPNPDSFLRVARSALLARAPGAGRPGLVLAAVGIAGAVASVVLGMMTDFIIGFCTGIVILLALGGIGTSMQLERARGLHADEALEGVRAVLRVLIIFALITPFYSLFDQKASTWIVQANAMVPVTFSLFGETFTWLPAQMQALNPLLVMLLIPFNNLVAFPALRRMGIEPTPLRRMTAGIACSGVAWIIIGMIQVALDAGTPVSMAWQILPYIILTLGEVLVSATGVEFAYSQAPASMKGAIMSFFYLAITIGNLWVLVVNAGVKNDAVLGTIKASGYGVMAFQMFFFAGFALLAALIFGLYARRYKMTDNYRS
jgi:POT family proton-dependent oligopeptide transporter